MERKKLSADEITERLKGLNGWNETENVLKKRFKFENFVEALEFVIRVGAIAEAHDHHPDILFGWGYAEMNLTTHDRGGVTELDFAVAQEVETLTAG